VLVIRGLTPKALTFWLRACTAATLAEASHSVFTQQTGRYFRSILAINSMEAPVRVLACATLSSFSYLISLKTREFPRVVRGDRVFGGKRSRFLIDRTSRFNNSNGPKSVIPARRNTFGTRSD